MAAWLLQPWDTCAPTFVYVEAGSTSRRKQRTFMNLQVVVCFIYEILCTYKAIFKTSRTRCFFCFSTYTANNGIISRLIKWSEGRKEVFKGPHVAHGPPEPCWIGLVSGPYLPPRSLLFLFECPFTHLPHFEVLALYLRTFLHDRLCTVSKMRSEQQQQTISKNKRTNTHQKQISSKIYRHTTKTDKQQPLWLELPGASRKVAQCHTHSHTHTQDSRGTRPEDLEPPSV